MATQMKNTDNKVSKDAKETIRMATQMETTDNMVGKDAKETIQRHPPEVAETIPTSSGSLIPIIILISFAAFGSYILGYLKWSILWTSVFLFTSYNFMFRRLNRLRQYHLNALQREAARQRLERHAESAEWLNFIIERLWNVLEPIISIKATEKINAVLLDSCPTFLDSLMLTEFTLGSSSPNIVTARVHPQTQPDIIVEPLNYTS